MADEIARVAKFKDAALVLADDTMACAARLIKSIRGGEYQAAEALAGSLQRSARDVKWLLRRLPKRD